ncbi:hypothetical protein [Variovorax atrisoli]|uniref:hypothetical protein n=1 Tax=Variovorax atrisoli TaxID=3394203 RepID=UPI003396E416
MAMEDLKILEWSPLGGILSEEAVRMKFPPPEYRVSPKFYKNSEVRPPASAREGLFFVLSGKCRCIFGGEKKLTAILEAGQYVNFPSGEYRVEPLDDRDVEILFVWNVLKIIETDSVNDK